MFIALYIAVDCTTKAKKLLSSGGVYADLSRDGEIPPSHHLCLDFRPSVQTVRFVAGCKLPGFYDTKLEHVGK